MTIDYRCLVCEKNDQWENVDQYRIKPSGMCICKSCGFVTYPARLKNKDTLKNYYQHDYRKPPTIANHFTQERKGHYHKAFLHPLFKKWKDENKAATIVTEIGAAYGFFLHHIIRGAFPDAQLFGTELTKSFVANAWEEFHIKLSDDFDASKKYDLIASYKVAEHIPDVDKELRKYAECLTEDGVLYISVPIWFKYMTNFGVQGFDVEYYYHPDHINTWTQAHFEYLLKKAGLEITQQNHCYYDSTYLCKRNDSLMDVKPDFQPYSKVVEKMDAIKKAWDFFSAKKYKEACEAYQGFPLAWSAHYEMNRKQFHELGWATIKDQFIKVALATMPDSIEVVLLCTDISMRYSQWDDALNLIEHGLKMSPQNPGALKALAHVFRQIAVDAENNKDHKKAFVFFRKARNTGRHLCSVSSQARDEAVTWVLNDNARMHEMLEKAGLPFDYTGEKKDVLRPIETIGKSEESIAGTESVGA